MFTLVSCQVDNIGVSTLIKHMVSTTLSFLSTHLEWCIRHVLSCHAYLISWLFLETFHVLPKRPLYTGTPSVFVHIIQSNVWGHTLINRSYPFLVYICACVWDLRSWVNLALRQILTWYQSSWRIPLRKPFKTILLHHRSPTLEYHKNWECPASDLTSPLRPECWFSENRLYKCLP